MTDHPPSKSPSSPDPSRNEVADLVRSIEESDEARRHADPPRPRGRPALGWYLLLALGILGNAYLWGVRPAWVFGEGGAAADTVDPDGRIRYRIYVLASRIESYRRVQGELPDRLEAVGGDVTGLEYRRTGPDAWELASTEGETPVVYRSSESMEAFLQPD